MANFGPYGIQTPDLIATKIVTVDYVRETTRYTNFGANPSTGLLGKWVKYNVKLFLRTYVHTYIRTYTFFFGEQPTGQTLRPILTRDDSKDA